MSSFENQSLSFLLVGKTGCGKSSMGNSVLGQNVFAHSDNSQSETTQIQVQSATVDGYNLTVVDTPGVMHTGLDLEAIKLKACNDMKEAVSKCPDEGKMAVVMVMKYGDRFTEENRTTVDILKQMFGEENLCKSCVIVMTHGDMFTLNDQQEKQFQDWMAEQTEDLGQLFSLVQYRCLLFNNICKDSAEVNQQRKYIIDLVNDQGYTKTQFSLLKKQHHRFILDTLFPKRQIMYRQNVQSLFDLHLSVSKSSRQPNIFEDVLRKLDQLVDNLNQEDDPRTIFYHDDEPRLFEEFREQLTKLKSDILKEIKIRQSDNEIDELIENVDNIIKDNNFDNLLDCESKYTDLLACIQSNPDLISLETRLDIVKKKLLKAMQVKVKISLAPQIEELRNTLKKTTIPTSVCKLKAFSNRLDQLSATVNEENVKVGGLDNLLDDIKDLKMFLEFKKEDNDMWIGWTTTSWIMSGAGLGLAFIPIVGLPISTVVSVVPTIGRAIHTAVVRKRRTNYLLRE
ncbi:GTPase IMAP family member 7 isoform X2 [Biomphalaria glabrata]|nr:GTPase IMAP family member 7 isoform X2 [Biomphalaria glabrata]